MAKYESKYEKLGFYVNDVLKNFSYGVYETENEDEIAVLDALGDAIRIVEPKVTAKTEEKATATPKATKAATKRTASAK